RRRARRRRGACRRHHLRRKDARGLPRRRREGPASFLAHLFPGSDVKDQALKTDLYQLTMAGAYFARGFRDVRVTCEAFLRRLPARRGFLVMAGVPRLVEYLADLAFTDDDIEFLHTLPALTPALTPDFIEYLRNFRFTGDVWAAPEGA